MFTDTHCHIHEASYEGAEGALARAKNEQVSRIICVGTDFASSQQAVEFAANNAGVWATIGAHPHDAKDGIEGIKKLMTHVTSNVVAVGEVGLDYFYTHSPRSTQITMFEAQLQLAKDYDLPVIFHVRDAFDDFWPIFGNFKGVRGVLHSFTDTLDNLERGLAEGLYIGINGISTFTKDQVQQRTFDAVPVEKMLLETDAPFLTPVPHRGKVNEPAFVRHVAEYHANRRGIELEHLARVTSANATTLFSLT